MEGRKTGNGKGDLDTNSLIFTNFYSDKFSEIQPRRVLKFNKPPFIFWSGILEAMGASLVVFCPASRKLKNSGFGLFFLMLLLDWAPVLLANFREINVIS